MRRVISRKHMVQRAQLSSRRRAISLGPFGRDLISPTAILSHGGGTDNRGTTDADDSKMPLSLDSLKTFNALLLRFNRPSILFRVRRRRRLSAVFEAH